ncbi:unnamed protein product, partial [Notodromas monacha]
SAQDYDIGVPYQDVKNRAAVLVHHDPSDESLLLDGIIGDNIVIRPAPISLKKQYYNQAKAAEKSRTSTTTAPSTTTTTSTSTMSSESSTPTPDPEHDEYDEFLSGMDEERTGLHVVYEKEKPLDAKFGTDYVLMEPDGVPTTSSTTSTSHSRKKRSAPYVIYPEVLIIVDYDTYL